jgi:tRNA(Arg) A34 adenosine deaminase TadA
MARHDRLIQRAVRVAATSEHRWMLGALVTQGSRVVASSTNKLRNPPWIDHLNATRHAEMAALARGLGDTIYIARVNKAGQTQLARPCAMCMKGLTLSGVRCIVFTNDTGGFTVERLPQTEPGNNPCRNSRR